MFAFSKTLRLLVLWLKPHKTIPQTPWRAEKHWDLAPLRLAILFLGLAFFGFGEALLIQSKIGNSPWSVFAQGVSFRTGISLGWATLITSCVVLLLWIPLREKFGFGTLANALVIPLALQLTVDHFPIQSSLFSGIVIALLGIISVGIATAFYISCGLGSGPRDGLMTAIHHRTGVRVGRVRLGLEVLVVAVGVALGGHAGLGTLLFALLIGQSVAISCGVLSRITDR
ncbi:MAG: YitT family protein [Actinomycetes bacterium]